MCCFSGPVDLVANTEIFASSRGDRQAIVYGMRYAAPSELAMVLPVPVAPGAEDDALRFIDLSGCPDFFENLSNAFPTWPYKNEIEGFALGGGEPKTLEVHDVGTFEASFVPSAEHFDRLDERFRLPVPLWLSLDGYRDWGFAVFKLKPSAKPLNLHPMAFEFARRDRERLFFPTLHLHDAVLHDTADFDHMLYCQPQPAHQWHLQGWQESSPSPEEYLRCPQAAALLDGRDPCWRIACKGRRRNRDTWLGGGATLPEKA